MNSTEILEKLVGFNTVSSLPNSALINWAADYLKIHGAAVEILQDGEKAALWARLGPAVEGGIVLAGHSDVVPTEGQNWHSDPFRLSAREGRLYGRGACDMKGFLACALALVPHIKQRPLKKPLYIALTYDEEVTMEGARKLAAWLKDKQIKPDWCWVGEPTDMHIVSAHKGVVASHTRLRGHAAHSSQTHRGCSAIHLAAKLVAWLEERETRIFEGSPFTPPRTSFNVGLITGGKAINIIPDSCELTWEFRLHPGDDEAAFWRDYNAYVESLLAPLRAAFPDVAIETETTFHAPPFANSNSAAADAQIMEATGQKQMGVASYATEASFFSALGAPAYICGPGSIDQAHQPDEYVACDQMAACEAALGRMAAFLE